ncbi:MAG: cytochrome P450 [Chloroflexota bacterium]
MVVRTSTRQNHDRGGNPRPAHVRPAAAMPGPRGLPLAGSLLDIQRDPLSFLSRAHRAHGDMMRVRLGPKTIYIASHPRDVQHVLQENARNYRKGDHYKVLRPVFGNGLMLSEGDFWLKQRRIVQPAFNRQKLGQFATTMTDLTSEMLQRWDVSAATGDAIDVWHEMVNLTLSIVCTSLFGVDISQQANGVGEAHSLCLQHAERQILALVPIPESLPTPANRRYQRAVATIREVIDGLIDERRSAGEDRGDLLSTLAFARYEETGELMDHDQLRAEVITLLLNGHETVSDALGWAFYLLSKHPHAARLLHQEVDTVLGGRTPTLNDLRALEYTSWVVQESMRLYPPAWVIERDTIATDEVGGYRLPPNSTVVLSQWVTHRHPDVWENPEGFDPERFSPKQSAGRHRFAYFPFGGGPRLCVGSNFAMMEMTLILAMIAGRYHLDLVPGHPVELEPVITLRPKHGILTTLRRRTPHSLSIVSTPDTPAVTTAPVEGAPMSNGRCPFSGGA